MIGIIGGSGLYDMAGLEVVGERHIDTPFGPTSDSVRLGKLDGLDVAFLPRHGRGHRVNPSEVPYRANIWALKSLGVRAILSVSAVGSLREEIRPGQLVFVDQFIDRTRGQRAHTFFEGGCVAHVSFADPTCTTAIGLLKTAAEAEGISHHVGGTYVCIEGPQFSTRAESRLYRSWGADVIGMTNLTEAKLAREAEIHYATIAMATDYDVWHESEEDVTVDAVMAIMHANVASAQRIIRRTAPALLAALDGELACGCHRALEHAVMTAPGHVSEAATSRLAVLLARSRALTPQ